MEDKSIKLTTLNEVYEKAASMLNEADIAYESNSLKNFVSKNVNKVRDICESNDQMDTMRLYALMEAHDLKETTTADMSIPDMAVGSKVMRNRLATFDPFGKNVANRSEGTKTVIKMDKDVLQEAIKSLNFDKATIIGTDIETSTKYSRVIVESESKKQELTIDRADFLKFVKNNADVKSYINEGKLDIGRYFESRTSAFVGTLIKEYFKSLIKEDTNQDFQINDFQVGNDVISVSYFYPSDIDARETTIPLDGFIQFIESKYDTEQYYFQDENDISMENPRGSYSLDFNRLWDTFQLKEQEMLIKQYMLTQNKVGNVQEAKLAKSKFLVEDYNQWKDIVATDSANDFEINEGVAKDGKGKLIGDWDRVNRKGYIYR